MLRPLQKRKMIQQGPDSNLRENCPLNCSIQGEFIQPLQGLLVDLQVHSRTARYIL